MGVFFDQVIVTEFTTLYLICNGELELFKPPLLDHRKTKVDVVVELAIKKIPDQFKPVYFFIDISPSIESFLLLFL